MAVAFHGSRVVACARLTRGSLGIDADLVRQSCRIESLRNASALQMPGLASLTAIFVVAPVLVQCSLLFELGSDYDFLCCMAVRASRPWSCCIFGDVSAKIPRHRSTGSRMDHVFLFLGQDTFSESDMSESAAAKGFVP